MRAERIVKPIPRTDTAMLRRGLFAALLAAGALFGAATAAHADICDALRSQLRTAAGGQSPEVAQLNRQLVAIRNLESRRQCSGKAKGGFFNACGDLSRRRAEVERKIKVAARQKGGSRDAIRARMANLGCAVAVARRDAARSGPPQSASIWRDGSDTLFCVRLSDGYFFPAPNSQFVQAANYKLIRSQCQYICDDPQMAVYELPDLSLETEEMVSVEERKTYKNLPNAFAYRDAANFKGCDPQRYHRRMNEARARATTPTTVDSAGIVLPLPAPRPDIDTVMAYSGETRPAADPFTRKVRIVGTPFLPNDRPTHTDLFAD